MQRTHTERGPTQQHVQDEMIALLGRWLVRAEGVRECVVECGAAQQLVSAALFDGSRRRSECTWLPLSTLLYAAALVLYGTSTAATVLCPLAMHGISSSRHLCLFCTVALPEQCEIHISRVCGCSAAVAGSTALHSTAAATRRS